uniref:Uncharacterized protein n=1 Tax=Phlebotomus papatasi TaxID=29031 RepID=A0A1B0DAN2_PHLPP
MPTQSQFTSRNVLNTHLGGIFWLGFWFYVVADWGRQQCQSTLVYVLPAPQLRIDPPSVTLYRGQSLRLRCLSSNNDHRYGPLGYSWSKNNQLFQSDPDTEFWEDLYPDGSILNIHNIQKSAEYSCIVSNMVAPVSKSVYITVIDKGVVELCPSDKLFGVQWPPSAPGPAVLADCPNHAAGQSRRICEQTDFAKPRWLQPDFSHCVPEHLGIIYNDFLEVTFGYQRSNTSVILQNTLEYAINRKDHFLPGEAAFLLRMLQEIHDYLDEVGSRCEREIASDTTLQILDIILKNEFSINNQQQVKHVQRLFLMAASNRESVATSGPKLAASTSNQLSSFRLHNTPVKALPFELQISGDQLFSDQLYLEINKGTTSLLDFVGNSSLSVTVISYRNLTSFLPHMYITRNRCVYASNNQQTIPMGFDMARVEMILQHNHSPTPEWVPVCGYDSSTNNQETWNTDMCLTENLLENITRCICPISGTYVVLLARQNYNRIGSLGENLR